MLFSELNVGNLFTTRDRPTIVWCKMPPIEVDPLTKETVNAVLTNGDLSTITYNHFDDNVECDVLTLEFTDDNDSEE